MKKSYRKISLGIVALMIMTLMTACSKGVPESTPTDTSASAETNTPVTITYWNLTATDMPFESDLIAQFESKNPDIKVQLERVPVESFHDKLILAAQTNTLPDVTQCIPEWSSDMVKAKAIKDITADIQDVKSTYIDSGIGIATWNEKVVGLPFRFGTSATFINKKMLDEAGLKVPESWTWDEFREYAKKLTDPSKGVYGFGIPGAAQNDLGFSWNYFSFAFQNGASFIKDGKAAFNSPEGVEALDFLKNMMDEGIMPPSTPSFTAKDVVDAFGSGKLAMWQNGPWYVATVKTSYPDIEYVCAPLPTKKDGAVASVSGGTYISVCEGTKHYEEALIFVKYMTSAENMREWAGKGEFLPPVKALLNDSSFLQGPMTVFAAQAQQPSIAIGATPENTKLMEIVQDEMNQALTNKKSSKDALDAAAAKWDEVLQQYK